MTVIGTPIIQSMPDRMTRLLSFALWKRNAWQSKEFRLARHMPLATEPPDDRQSRSVSF